MRVLISELMFKNQNYCYDFYYSCYKNQNCCYYSRTKVPKIRATVMILITCAIKIRTVAIIAALKFQKSEQLW